MEKRCFFWIGTLILGFLVTPIWECLSADLKYPTKPIQIVVGFNPGDTDSLIRPFTEKMTKFLGQPFNFVYKPGAGGAVGAGFVAAAKPDGYTLLGAAQSSMTTVPLAQKLNYSLESFSPITPVAEAVFLLVVRTDSPWKNIKEFVAAAKRSPGEISYSTPGTFTIIHLIMETFAKEAQIKLNHVPCQGTTPAVTAVLGGHVNAAMTSLAPASPHLQTGALRVLAITNPNRARTLPDAPTLSELGYPVQIPGYYGLLAPQNTPGEVIKMLNQAIKKTIEMHGPFLKDRLNKLGADIAFMEPDGYKSWLKSQYTWAEKVLKDLGK